MMFWYHIIWDFTGVGSALSTRVAPHSDAIGLSEQAGRRASFQIASGRSMWGRSTSGSIWERVAPSKKKINYITLDFVLLWGIAKAGFQILFLSYMTIV